MPSDHRLHPTSILFSLAGSLKAFLVPAIVLMLTTGTIERDTFRARRLRTGAVDEPLDAGRRRDRQLAVLAPAVPDSQHHRGRGALPVLPRALRRHGAGDSFRASLPQRAPRAVCADPEPRRGEKRGAPAAGRRRGPRRDRGRTGARGHDPRPARDRLRGDAAADLRGPGARAGGCAAAGDAGGRGSGRRIEDAPAPAAARAVAQRPAGQPRHAARGRGLRRAVGGGALSRGLESSGARRLWAGAGARHGADDRGGRRAVAGPDRWYCSPASSACWCSCARCR